MRKYTVIALVALVAVVCSVAIVLDIQTKMLPPNPIENLKTDVSEVLVTGKGYTFDKNQEKAFEKKVEKKEKKKEEESQEVSQNQERTKAVESKIKDNKEGEKESKLPIINSDLVDGASYGGTFKGFYITAKDYKNRIIKMTDGGTFEVYGNGQKLYSTGGSDHEKVSYKIQPLLDGENTVKAVVKDKYGNKGVSIYTFNGDTTGEQEVEGRVKFSIEAGSIGLGTIVEGSTKVYVGDQGSAVLDRFLSENGYLYDYSGTMTNGFYLKKIKKDGIANGAKIQTDIMEHLEDEGYTETPWSTNSLGEKDFTQWSGWALEINGDYPDQGFSGYTPMDGDIVRIRFTLWDYKDINGEWGNY